MHRRLVTRQTQVLLAMTNAIRVLTVALALIAALD
jgi:hypothetical protein